MTTPLREWKEAVIDALVVSHLYDADAHDDNPRAALNRLLTGVALDPAVSAEARELRDTFREDAERYRALRELWNSEEHPIWNTDRDGLDKALDHERGCG